jgi:O-antigen biosynthesis protein
MAREIPSLEFEPQFFDGGPSRFHLPFLYDLIASHRPRHVVVLGFGGEQLHFAICQTAQEQDLAAHCLTIRRLEGEENPVEDKAWADAIAKCAEFFPDAGKLSACDPVLEAGQHAERSVDLLLIDDCDSAAALRAELRAWAPKLTGEGLVLVHGISIEREESLRKIWDEFCGDRPAYNFEQGIGLAVTGFGMGKLPENSPLVALYGSPEARRSLLLIYDAIAARITAQNQATTAAREKSALQLRQVWLDTLLHDRWKAQEVMDHLGREVTQLRQVVEEGGHDPQATARAFADLRQDRGKAQLIMDAQAEQLKQEVSKRKALSSENKKLKSQVDDQKRELQAAKKACRKGGRCFRISAGGNNKEQRSIPERIVRELRRIPRNLRRISKGKPVLLKESPPKEETVADRYAQWILKHEPDAAGLEAQRAQAMALKVQPKISLLLPIHNTEPNFLDELLTSLAAQTYGNFEVCAVDGGSSSAATLDCLKAWQQKEPRLRIEFLAENLGIAENTNRAMAFAEGDFIACIDHDDLLAPFAMFELARAIGDFPDADIFYSDEDRWSTKGERHAPFFKPEWSPELLCSFMYIGHLTAYRRSLVDQIGGFRRQFDLSQDYDFALRATERARSIRHIPHVLYHWREHPGSGSAGGKPEARRSNLAALGDAMRRRNLPAEIIEYPAANRARLEISQWPRVSVIVPTDSPTRAQICLRDLPRKTKYPDLEIVVVTTTALIESLRTLEVENATIQFVAYDKPFNFSDKCNVGAAAATGERLIFFNDDVEPVQSGWVQNVIEPLENPDVGAVAPKLLYETGKIQHAGLVTGVRGLIGTAFHERAQDSTEHANLAQSLRNVAALSAACLAMRRDDFKRLGGFDAVNTPISHSDVDLCFKIREAGLRSVYTPYATLNHAGHVSIGLEEEKKDGLMRNKASIYLLKRWAHYTTHDPYFPDNMRDWLYSDSPTPIRMVARDQPAAVGSSPDLLFVSHDLSLSGAPMMLFYAARWCRDNGIFVLVMAPTDGPLAAKLESEGIPFIIDPLIETGHESFARFARDFDCVIANTILGGPVVRAMEKENVPLVWWLHEPVSVSQHFIKKDATIRTAFPLPDLLFAPSERTAATYRPFTDRPIKCLRNAIPDLDVKENGKPASATARLRFLLLGSVESRKGQDVFVQAIASLPREVQEAAEFQIAGRILDPDFWLKVEIAARPIKNLSVTGELNHAEAIELMTRADVIVSASRDESMPITMLEAMCLGKALIATTVGGALEVLVEGENALLVRPESPEGMAATIRRITDEPTLISKLGEAARETYEKHFTMERFGREFRAGIDEAISASASVSRSASD